MKKFVLTYYFLTLTLISLLLSSCSTETIVQSPVQQSLLQSAPNNLGKDGKTKKWPPEFVIDSCFGYGRITIDTNLHKPDKEIDKDSEITPSLNEGDGCTQMTLYGWGIDHYERVSGKVLGIWNNDMSQSELSRLKTTYGYSGLLIPSGRQDVYSLATNALGFNAQDLMVQINYIYNTTDWQTWINNMLAGSYYLGEPFNHGCVGNNPRSWWNRIYEWNEFIAVRNYITQVNQNRPYSAKFVIDGYKRCDHLTTPGQYADLVMYSSYDDWYYAGLGCNPNMSWGSQWEGGYWDGSWDQRDSWTDMRNIFGSKFSRTWIKTGEAPEFSVLFGHAKNLGLDQVWVYNYDTGYNTDAYDAISQYAYQNGYLRQFVREIRLVYRCNKYVYPNLPCPCNRTMEEDWELVSITPTGYVKEN